MNVIIRKHYPASRLPDDLREGLPADGTVDIRIVGEPQKRLKLSDLLGTGRNVHGNDADVLAYLAETREDR
jgi:hypothetical protein